MGDESWYYLDRNGLRQGPLPRVGIAEALRRGNLGADGKVQRDGDASWLPLSWAGFATADQITERLPGVAVVAKAERKPRSARDIVHASLLRRGAARFIDLLLLGAPFALFAALWLVPADQAPNVIPIRLLFDLGKLALVFVFVAMPLYQTVFLGSASQATPGKRALGIKVTDMDGEAIGFGRALGRSLAEMASWAVLAAGFFIVPFTVRRQALHDLLADTLVVDRWAYTDSPQLQLRSPPPLQVAFVGLLVVALVASLKLYGVASDALQALVARSQVFIAWAEVSDDQKAVAEFWSNRGEFPADSASAGVVAREIPQSHPFATASIDHGLVVVTFDDRAVARLRGRRLVLRAIPGATSIHFICGSEVGTNLDVEDQPVACRH